MIPKANKYELMTMVEYRIHVEASSREEAEETACKIPFTYWEQWSVEPAIVLTEIENG